MSRKTECYPFWNLEDIKKMIDGFTNKDQWHWRLAFMIGLLMGRRVGDTLKLKWSDLYYTDGKHRVHLEIEEEKTGKITYVAIPSLVWKEVELYIDMTGTDPSMNNYNNFIFPGTSRKDAAYREAFKKVAKEAKIPYNVNTHSTRKTFGYYGIKLHPYHPANLDTLQRFFVHSSREMTANYIGLSQEKQDKYSNDWASVVSDISEGRPVAIENTPVITIKSNDLRDIIVNALKMPDNTESLNSILRKVEEIQISY